MTPSPTNLLSRGQVPNPPAVGSSWIDMLRWLIAVMDPGDRDLAMVASLLSSFLQNDGLSSRQDSRARVIAGRIMGWWELRALQCQRDDE